MALNWSEEDLEGKTADFSSLKLRFEVFNNTTNMEIKQAHTIEMIEFDENSMVLEMASKNGSRGHHLLVKLFTQGIPKMISPIQFTAKIEKLENLNRERDQVSLKFLQFQENEWQHFCKWMEQKQLGLLELMSTIKGG